MTAAIAQLDSGYSSAARKRERRCSRQALAAAAAIAAPSCLVVHVGTHEGSPVFWWVTTRKVRAVPGGTADGVRQSGAQSRVANDCRRDCAPARVARGGTCQVLQSGTAAAGGRTGLAQRSAWHAGASAAAVVATPGRGLGDRHGALLAEGRVVTGSQGPRNVADAIAVQGRKRQAVEKVQFCRPRWDSAGTPPVASRVWCQPKDRGACG